VWCGRSLKKTKFSFQEERKKKQKNWKENLLSFRKKEAINVRNTSKSKIDESLFITF
jgi:hypothetical protein